MKKLSFLMFSFSIMLMACKQSKPSATIDDTDTVRTDSMKTVEQQKSIVEYDVIDAQTFGLIGKVQSVSIQSFLTNEVNGNLTEGSIVTESEMTFDQWGHVTKDEWGNEYGYDADGNYYRGNHTYTLLKRDKSGRIKEYIDEEPNTDNQDNQKIVFDYDKTGRLKTVTQGGWTGHWQEQRSYEGGNTFPSKIVTSADYEGGGESHIAITYRYSKFDEKKNWIERICVISIAETGIWPADTIPADTIPAANIGGGPQMNEQIRIEKRNIVYYE